MHQFSVTEPHERWLQRCIRMRHMAHPGVAPPPPTVMTA